MWKKLLALVMSLCMVVGMGTTALASETDQQSEGGFYVMTEEVPQQATEYVRNNVGGMISDLADLDNVTVGTLFKIANAYYDLYYSIIYANDEIIGTYRVFEDENGYTGIFSENTEMINGLKDIAYLTSSSKPAKIVAGDHNDIYAIIDSVSYPVLTDAEGNSTDEQNLLSAQNNAMESVVNVCDGIDFIHSNDFGRSTPSYKYLQIGWAETQGSLPWCMAYVTASIMRYKTGNDLSTISARTVMKWAYPNLSTTELESTALSTSKADEFANTYGIDPTYIRSRRTYSQIVSEIKGGSPVAFICDNVKTGTKRSHAFVCRGYNDNNGNSFYSVWNPWYSQFERVYSSDNTYVNSAGTAKYLWSATMYGWN